ncbi:MAG: hypothetical protein ACE5FC_04240 [Myxococcota bacterium]
MANFRLRSVNLRAGDFSPVRLAVNAWLLTCLSILPACAGSAPPANWVLQAQGWSLPPKFQAYDPPCRSRQEFPRWVLKAKGRQYRDDDYAFLGTGEGTVDLAPRSHLAGAEEYNARPVKGRHRLAGIATPFAKALGESGESMAHVRLYVRGGGTIDAKWLVRGEAEAKGVDLLGESFSVPDDTIGLVQGRQAVAGVGVGRVGLRITDQFEERRVYYGLNAGIRHDREAAAALGTHGYVRVPANDLIKVKLPGRRYFGIPALAGALTGGAPIDYALTVPSALLVSVKSVLLAPFHRPVAGIGVRAGPEGGPPQIAGSGFSDGLLWIAIRPPAGDRVLWVAPAGAVQLEWPHAGEDHVAEARGPRGKPLVSPQFLDPGAGTRFFFRVHDLPSRFNLIINDLRTLDGTAAGPWVYNMKPRTRIRWNPVSVWREWMCD